MDIGIDLALLVGIGTIALVLPFRQAVLVYRQHYYMPQPRWRLILEALGNLGPHISRFTARWVLLFLLLVGLAAAIQCARRRPNQPIHEWVALLSTAMLPLWCLLFGKYITHSMEIRYAVPAIFAVAACWGIVLAPLARRTSVFLLAVAVLFAADLAVNLHRIAREQKRSDLVLAGLVAPPQLKAELAAQPDRRLFVQEVNQFFIASYYEPDPLVRSRFTYIADCSSELRYLHQDTCCVAAAYMRHFVPLSFATYQQFLAIPEPLAVVYRKDWEWIGRDLDARGAKLKFIGPYMDAGIYRVLSPGNYQKSKSRGAR